MSTIAITSALGKISSATIAALQGKGHTLIGIVRNAEKAKALAEQGVELRVGDLEKGRSLKGLFAGADTAFIVVPAGPLAPLMASNALWEARQAGVKHVVRLSAVGAAHDAPTVNSRLHAVSDSELALSGMPYTILKPHFFMQNALMAAQTVAEQGVMYWALAEGKLAVIDARDVGVAAAAVLNDPKPHAQASYTLTGPASITMHQFAAAVGEAVGKPVKYVPIPVAAAVENLVKFGLDDFGQQAMGDYFAAYSTSWQAEVTNEVRRLSGQEPRSVAQFARDFAGAFGKRV